MKLVFTGIPIALLAAAAAAPALAGGDPDPRPGDTLLGKRGGIAYVTDLSTTDNPASTSALAACPNAGGQWRLTGGGARSSTSIPDLVSSRHLDLAASYGDPDNTRDDYWEAITGESQIGAELTSYAICSRMKGLKYRSEPIPSGPVAARTGTAACPAGKVPTGGGGFIATTGSFLGSMYPAGSSWSVGAFDNIGGPGVATVDYVCGRSRGRSVVKVAGTVPASGTLTLQAKCRNGRHVLGGGVRYRGSAAFGRISSSYPIDRGDADAIPDDGWRATVSNLGPANVGANVYAICRR